MKRLQSATEMEPLGDGQGASPAGARAWTLPRPDQGSEKVSLVSEPLLADAGKESMKMARRDL